MKEIKASIFFKITEDHKDRKYVDDISKELKFTDTYYDRNNYYDDYEQFKEYIKRDLMLVAGGGYNTENIYDLRFEFSR